MERRVCALVCFPSGYRTNYDIRSHISRLLTIFDQLSVIACSDPAAGRESRLLNPLSIVKFPNAACTASSATNTMGTCYSASECASLGEAGQPLTTCQGAGCLKYNLCQAAQPPAAAPAGSGCAAPSASAAGLQVSMRWCLVF